jgi:predicted CxxxxCH...CXXCH cytochrome family protein
MNAALFSRAPRTLRAVLPSTLAVLLLACAGCFGPEGNESGLLDPNSLDRRAQDGAIPNLPAPRLSDAGTPQPGNGSAAHDAASRLPTADAGGAAAAEPMFWPGECKEPWLTTKRHHDEGYGKAEVHGLESNLQKDDCRSCHGPTLDGCAYSPSCNDCHSGGHAEGWRTDCKYCHGGSKDETGAPPRDIDGRSTPEQLSFRAHGAHVIEGKSHFGYACDTCHVEPEDIFSMGHIFDMTAGKAEVRFSGLSSTGMYKGMGSCANLACHGNGRTPASVEHTAKPMDCNGCHGDASQAAKLSGAHARHLTGSPTGGPMHCGSCHGSVATSASELKDKALHIDGKVQFTVPSGSDVVRSGTTCTGTCHGMNHSPIPFLVPNMSWTP